MADLTTLDGFLDFTADELMIAREDVYADTEFRKIPVWSSLNALILISRINEETNVLISAGDLATCQTFRNIHDLILTRS